jgi:hypothetical protein
MSMEKIKEKAKEKQRKPNFTTRRQNLKERPKYTFNVICSLIVVITS